jgi:hypothetical protein
MMDAYKKRVDEIISLPNIHADPEAVSEALVNLTGICTNEPFDSWDKLWREVMSKMYAGQDVRYREERNIILRMNSVFNEKIEVGEEQLRKNLLTKMNEMLRIVSRVFFENLVSVSVESFRKSLLNVQGVPKQELLDIVDRVMASFSTLSHQMNNFPITVTTTLMGELREEVEKIDAANSVL